MNRHIIIVGNYVVLKKGIPEHKRTTANLEHKFPLKVKEIFECTVKSGNEITYKCCRECNGRVNNICFGDVDFGYILEPKNMDWDD